MTHRFLALGFVIQYVALLNVAYCNNSTFFSKVTSPMDIVLAAAVFGLIIVVLLIFTYVLRYAEFKSELQYLKSEIKRSDPGSGNQKYWRKKYRQLVKEFWLFF